MYKFRKHRIKSGHALDRRKLKENFLHLASRLNEIDGSAISRLQFDIDDFRTNAFIEFYETGYKDGAFSGKVSGEGGESILNLSANANLELSGDYALTWNAELTPIATGNSKCMFVDCTPVMGNQLVSSANDCYYHMGYLNSSSPCRSFVKSASMYNLRDLEGKIPYESIEETWNNYGKIGNDWNTDLMNATQTNSIDPHYRKLNENNRTQESLRIHLSGFGYINMPRSNGQVSLVFHGQPGSVFKVDSARISLRKRNR